MKNNDQIRSQLCTCEDSQAALTYVDLQPDSQDG